MRRLSAIGVGVSILLSALALVPTREGLALFVANAAIVVTIRWTARRGF